MHWVKKDQDIIGLEELAIYRERPEEIKQISRRKRIHKASNDSWINTEKVGEEEKL